MKQVWKGALIWALTGCATVTEPPDEVQGTTTAETSPSGTSGGVSGPTSDASGGTSSGSAGGSSASGLPDPSTTSVGSASVGSSSDASAGSSSDASTAAVAPEVPGGVFLYVDPSEGGPDLEPSAVYERLADASVDVELGQALPADFATRFGTMFYLNPLGMFDPVVNAAAVELVDRGGRVVLVMEHCKNGCYGSADGHNEVLSLLGSTMTFYGDGGGALESISLELDPAPPLTDGVNDLVIYYSGRVEVGAAEPVGRVPGGDTVIAREQLGWGEVVCIADGSMFGYVMDAGDNPQFTVNLALH